MAVVKNMSDLNQSKVPFGRHFRTRLSVGLANLQS